MRTKKTIAAFACIMLALFLLGATNIVQFAKGAEDGAPADDRLIGVLLTTEHLDLFDIEGYLNDNLGKLPSGGEISESDSAAYQGRIYAELVDVPYTDTETGAVRTTKEFVFTELEGIPYFAPEIADGENSYTSNSGDEAISDGNMALSVTDEGSSVTLEGTVYVSTRRGPRAFFFNPVYQSAQGEVYVTAGQGMSHGGEISDGMSSSQEIKEERRSSVNGETSESGAQVKVTVCYIDPPEQIALVQMSADSRVVERAEYAAGTLPETLTVNAEAEYLIVETVKKSASGVSSVTRELYQPEDESLCAFACRDDGVCVKQWCSIDWNR